MKHMAKHLVELFVDGSDLSHSEASFLVDNKIIEEVEPGAWQLTELGKQILKNQT